MCVYDINDIINDNINDDNVCVCVWYNDIILF